MSTDPPRPAGANDDPDEKTRRAMEIHRRLMQEQGLDFYNRPVVPAPPPAAPPASGEEDKP
ncbi:MAG TPA: hypothetical protein VFH27_02745 [Longimicrobiaceae bacterium]|nr:hypothetical protein [Longimicrobiaceae bacterium]